MKVSMIFTLLPIVISGLSVLISMISFYKTKNFNEYKERIRLIERKEDLYITKEEFEWTKTESRVNFMPYFHLELNRKISQYVGFSNKEYLEIPITIVNIGKETATNVSLEKITNSNNYFEINDINPVQHDVRRYFDKEYARATDKIKFLVACEKHSDSYKVRFKISYNDLFGRKYEQSFNFLYCYDISDQISLNHYTGQPICIKEKV